MKMFRLLTLLVCLPFLLAGCIDDGYDDYDDDSGSGSGSEDALSGPTVAYTFTCAAGSTNTINVTDGPCQSQQENYASTFGCNEVDNFQSACSSYYSCLVNNSSGSYADSYQQQLNYCSSYGNVPDQETVMILLGRN